MREESIDQWMNQSASIVAIAVMNCLWIDFEISNDGWSTFRLLNSIFHHHRTVLLFSSSLRCVFFFLDFWIRVPYPFFTTNSNFISFNSSLWLYFYHYCTSIVLFKNTTYFNFYYLKQVYAVRKYHTLFFMPSCKRSKICSKSCHWIFMSI